MKEFTTKPTKVIEFEGIEIEVKQFLKADEKEDLAKLYIANCFDTNANNEFVERSAIFPEVIYPYLITKFYTNLEVDSDNCYNTYDNLVGSGLFERVLSSIPGEELMRLKNVISNYTMQMSKRIKEQNSIESVVERFLEKVIEKLPNEKQITKYIKLIEKQVKEITTPEFQDKIKNLKEVTEQ